LIYILHIDPPLAHARHYVGWTKDQNVARRVGEHLAQSGRRPSKLVRAALAAGRTVTLAATIEGDRDLERRLKAGGGAARYCPLCKPAYNARAVARMRVLRARRRQTVT
jgi:hypothetical protein